MNPVLHLSSNITGRDFVVGDVHGAFDLVLKAMDEAKFDPSRDRLLLVGDLIDRGQWSHLCAEFLSYPYVYAVRGNHEDMLIGLYQDGEPSPAAVDWQVRNNGLGWWLGVSEALRSDILGAISELPYAIEVESPRGLVGLIHADVPAGMSWQTFVGKLRAGDEAVIECCLWGRGRLRANNEDGVWGVGRVFVGHTPHWDGLRRYGNVYALDSGAVFRANGSRPDGRLTVANMLMQTVDLTLPRQCVTMVDLRDGGIDPRTPFGQYAVSGR